MTFVKTESGRDALRRRDSNLSPRERQIIILFNGTHSRATIQQLMMRDIGVELHRLLEFGYLEERIGAIPTTNRAPLPPKTLPRAVSRPVRATRVTPGQPEADAH
jgi:FixJ family two-component response regulator